MPSFPPDDTNRRLDASQEVGYSVPGESPGGMRYTLHLKSLALPRILHGTTDECVCFMLVSVQTGESFLNAPLNNRKALRFETDEFPGGAMRLHVKQSLICNKQLYEANDLKPGVFLVFCESCSLLLGTAHTTSYVEETASTTL